MSPTPPLCHFSSPPPENSRMKKKNQKKNRLDAGGNIPSWCSSPVPTGKWLFTPLGCLCCTMWGWKLPSFFPAFLFPQCQWDLEAAQEQSGDEGGQKLPNWFSVWSLFPLRRRLQGLQPEASASQPACALLWLGSTAVSLGEETGRQRCRSFPLQQTRNFVNLVTSQMSSFSLRLHVTVLYVSCSVQKQPCCIQSQGNARAVASVSVSCQHPDISMMSSAL